MAQIIGRGVHQNEISCTIILECKYGLRAKRPMVLIVKYQRYGQNAPKEKQKKTVPTASQHQVVVGSSWGSIKII
jgi:hypothetical protein